MQANVKTNGRKRVGVNPFHLSVVSFGSETNDVPGGYGFEINNEPRP
jgi:hypothetical protein